MTKQYDVLSGPDKDSLMSSLSEKGKTIDLTFESDPEDAEESIVTLEVISLVKEDGSHESWLLEGNVLALEGMSLRRIRNLFPGMCSSSRAPQFKAYFHTQRVDRIKGWIEFI